MAGLSVYLMGAVAGLLVDLRNEWAVQILVLFSFSLQIFLLMFAWIRRQKVATLLRFLLWLAYQLADSTALFTLGHMAIRARSPDEQQLMAFWAPFLLVHLGGQDTITAYSFEDNRLWLRHLETLVVQILGAAYVLYKYIPGNETLIRVAAILMFIVGGLKYGERIWALRSASMDNIWSSLDKSDTARAAREREADRVLLDLCRKRFNWLDHEDILMAAHGLLDVCKGLFLGSRRCQQGYIKDVMLRCQAEGQLDWLMEMELSLMYDILYTKAAVIHTWYGWCIRVISPVATAIAFLLFEMSSNEGGGHGHKKNDVVITRVLLAGALILEMASLVKAAGSTWTVAFLYSRRWSQLYEFQDFRLFAGAAARRTWSGSVGQYSLLQSWAPDEEKPTGARRMAELMGLERWWFQVRHSHSGRISSSTKELVLSEILVMGNRRNVSSQPGLLALKQYQLDGHFGWSVEDSDLEGSIIAWHVATEIVARPPFDVHDDVKRLQEACQEVSKYMMFLFMVRPYMLPGPVRRSRHAEARDGWNRALEKACTCNEPVTEKRRLHWAIRAFRKKLYHMEIPLSRRQEAFLDIFPHEFPPSEYGPAVGGFAIAQELSNHPKALEVIFGVWVEMICYVANHCSRESHASQLASGGELITIAWLMAGHANLANILDVDAHFVSKWRVPELNPQFEVRETYKGDLFEKNRRRSGTSYTRRYIVL